MTIKEWKKENCLPYQAVGFAVFGFYSGIEVLDILYSIDDTIIWRYSGCKVDNKIHRARIHYWPNGNDWYFKTTEGLKIYGSEIMRRITS